MNVSLAQMRAEFGSAIAGSAPGLPTANQLCTACVAVLGVDGAAISMVFDGASQGTYGSSSESSRRLDEYQFTFGQGPCLDATAGGVVVHGPDLDSPGEQRWPFFTDAVLGDGIRAVFALPVRITSTYVGALDLFRTRAGPLEGDALAGGMMAAELAALPLLTLLSRFPDVRGVDGSGPTDHLDDDGPDDLVEIARVEVYQATGMLIAQLGVDADEALTRLRAHALATGATATEVARQILDHGLRLERDNGDHRHDDHRHDDDRHDEQGDEDDRKGPRRS